MYCNRCGATLQPQQNVCPSCGQTQQLAQVATAQSRLASHVHLLAIFWFIIAALFSICAVALLLAGSVAGAFMHAANAPVPARLLGPAVIWIIGVFFAALAAISYITAYGLLKMRPWARVLAIVLGFLALLHPPFGTALGIYTLIVLLPSAAGEEYERMAVPA